MAFGIALAVIVLISWLSIKFRCYMCFNVLMFGIAALIAGLIRDESLFTTWGIVFLLGGLLIIGGTARRVEKSRRMSYAVHLFLAGLFAFLRVMMIMLIVTIGLAGTMNVMFKDYYQMVLVDCNGGRIGEVYVDENLRGADGTQYRYKDRY